MFELFGKVNFSPCTKVSEFAGHLKDGRLMGSKCKRCGHESFPPKADCNICLSDEFDYVEFSGKATLLSHTKIYAAPTGFEDDVPYRIGVVDLEETGRLLAWFGDSIEDDEIKIGMKLQVLPQMSGDEPDARVYYSLEQPGTK
ncbi:MAG: Zn-ribbon domain-containing OB-fold protein [candidate division Zixibacteria bacterium]